MDNAIIPSQVELKFYILGDGARMVNDSNLTRSFIMHYRFTLYKGGCL